MCLVSNQFFTVRTISCATFLDLTSITTICFNCYYSLNFFRVHNNNCSIHLYNRDHQTTIILFIRNVSSHKTDWIVSELPLPALSCLLYRMVNSLMNALKVEWICLYEISLNVNKLFIVVFVFLYVVVAYLLLNPFFILMLLLHFFLLVNHVNNSIQFDPLFLCLNLLM